MNTDVFTWASVDTAAACSDHAAFPSLFLSGSSKQSQTRQHPGELSPGLCHNLHNLNCLAVSLSLFMLSKNCSPAITILFCCSRGKHRNHIFHCASFSSFSSIYLETVAMIASKLCHWSLFTSVVTWRCGSRNEIQRPFVPISYSYQAKYSLETLFITWHNSQSR